MAGKLSMLAVVLAWLSPLAAAPPQQDTSSPPCFASLSRAKLISPGHGWAVVDQPSNRPQLPSEIAHECTEQHLYWTDDDGQTWREIGPASMPTRYMGFVGPATGVRTVFFLDRLHGWMISSDAVNDEPGAVYYLQSTDDGGKIWRTLEMHWADFKLMDGFRPVQIYFADPNHGWMLWHWAVMHGRASALLSTTDGGRTWTRLPDPIGIGPIDFVSSRDGWMIGGAPGQMGFSPDEANQLWATGDGGQRWHAVSIAGLPADLEGLEFTDLKFSDRNRGIVTARVYMPDGIHQTTFACVTEDGGRSWRISKFDAFDAYPSLVNLHVLWTIFQRADARGTAFDWKGAPRTLRVADREFAPSLPDTLSLEGDLNGVDFADDSHGWASYMNGNPGRFGIPGSPFTVPELLSTTDGGATFHVITPPAANAHPVPPPQIYIINGSIIRFPPAPPLGIQRPPLRSAIRRFVSFSPPAGGPTIITGTGFEHENDVWIGTRKIQVPSDDGKNLRFLIPADIAPGTYPIYVENTHGRTDQPEISVRPPQSLAAIRINNGEPIHAGQDAVLTGPGLLIENQVWFGTQAVIGTLVISGAPIVEFTVPASLAPGSYDVYVSNANGKSNIVTVVVD